MQIARTFKQAANRISNAMASLRWGSQYGYDTLPPEKIRAAASKIPFVRDAMVRFSLDEYERNPHYTSVINKLAEHTVGPYPSIIGLSKDTSFNDQVEDGHLDWMRDNSVGKTYRELRKQAALTGIGIAIPFNKQTLNGVSLAYKTYGGNCLKNPYDAQPEDRIFNGIEYDKNWEPYKFHIIDLDHSIGNKGYSPNDTKEYTIDEVLYWSQGYENGVMVPLPECLAAFQIYPFIRRFLQAAIEGEEFKASFPIVVELDSAVYSPTSKVAPAGEFEYEPRTIKTLPVGAKLNGIPSGMSSSEQSKLIRLFASTCALTVSMPAVLALGDSSDSNMSSSQVDTQPWVNKVAIDRFDMEPMLRRSFRSWYSLATRKEGIFTQRANIARKHSDMFPHLYVYADIHSHPDPNKRANARAVDLASGATTLNRIYSQLGLNARRELIREAELLGMTLEEYQAVIVSSRSARSIDVVLDQTKGTANANG